MSSKQREIKLLPEVLRQLRETSGYSVDEIAKRLKTTEKKIKEVEAGESAFTLSQIEKLANVYKRPLAAFFSDSIPKLPELVDFRINREKRLSPQVYLAQRKAQYLSEKIEELSGEKSQIPSFPKKFKPDKLAEEFKKYLNIQLLKSKKPTEILAYYKKILEDKLKIIVIEYPMKADDVRAFSIHSDISVIVLNEEDKPSIKLFSLIHEVCHLVKNTAGICSLEIEQEDQKQEFYCNKFAAEFLVPLGDLKLEIEKLASIDDESIDKLSEIYGVSKQVIMLRLLWLGYIGKERYNQFKSGLKEPPPKKFGRRNWEKVFLNRVGELSLQEVKRAYHEEKITYYEALSILGLKTQYAEKIFT